MKVDVRDALADHVVEPEERSSAPRATCWAARDPAPGVHQPAQQAGRNVSHGGPVMAGHDEGVAGKHRADVEESDQVGLFENHVGFDLAARYPVEDAVVGFAHGHPSSRDDAWMQNESSVPFTAGPPETVLPPPPEDALQALNQALALPPDRRRDALAAVVAAHPSYLDGWARLAAAARDDVEAYAYARVGYHRGLDALRGAGWRGSGYVRWARENNRGFFRALDALRSAADAIGESTEAERCDIFLHQLDPDWDPAVTR